MEEPSGGGGGDQSKSTGVSSSYRGKSCKGCLYYSSSFKSNARNPLCVGIGRTLPQVPSYIVGESEMEATNDGRNLLDFKYACVGYSVYLDKNEDNREKGENQAELPFCAGLELLVDRRASSSSNAPARVHNKEDGGARHHPHPPKAAQPIGEEFISGSPGMLAWWLLLWPGT
ncbi:hypothetical protein HPP92_022282 [Vanilla planifolia]|uniref:DUF8204 domain-containing protein n=1 Tax=Vanilla planifolia TaxID=51239 RepID=A0A835PR76_VANPL|nr:hypothetical protein HPP92_022282 [Vanilla planifolia]